jgi:nucleolar protein 9
MAAKTQGALLLQSMLHLSAPHNQVVLDRYVPIVLSFLLKFHDYISLWEHDVQEQIAMAHDVTASRVLDAVLHSPTVPFKEKRKFVMNFIGHYEVLVDDRIGSRVGDNCWLFADTYLKVSLATNLCLRPLLTLFGSVGEDCPLSLPP